MDEKLGKLSLGISDWMRLAEKLTAEGDSIWSLLKVNSVVIGVRKLRPKNGGI
ncbi:MAG: hypothetical protein QXM86_04955 [Candidatus Bathyarchaeia archaeon]